MLHHGHYLNQCHLSNDYTNHIMTQFINAQIFHKGTQNTKLLLYQLKYVLACYKA